MRLVRSIFQRASLSKNIRKNLCIGSLIGTVNRSEASKMGAVVMGYYRMQGDEI
jgi:hypothetical protein